MDLEQYYTVQEIRELLKISDRTLYRYIKSGQLKAEKFMSRYRISESNLKEFLKNSKSDTTDILKMLKDKENKK